MGPHKYRRNFFFEVFNGRSNYIDLGLCITARPAPRTARPLAGLPNPYPYGCSVLCNHPKDPELKDVVWRPRISSTHDSGAEHYDNSKMMKRANRAGLSHDEGSIFHHNWEQKIISNALGSYAEKGRACPMTSSANQLAIRRCASGGPSPVERRSQKTEGMLVLDLRPWKSFDNVSSITDGQHEPLDNFERFELKSPRTRMQDKPGRSTRPIKRPETILSKSFKEVSIPAQPECCTLDAHQCQHCTSRETLDAAKQSILYIQWDNMATGELNLFIAGVQQKIFVEHGSMKETTDSYKLKLSRTKVVFTPKSNSVVLKTRTKQSTELVCETESNCSSSSFLEANRPVIWVDIVKKLPTQEVSTLSIAKPTSRKPATSIWTAKKSHQGDLLPDGFQIYIRKNLNLIAEVQSAKRRRSDNRDIFRAEQEDDVNWTSNAPRPSEWLLKPPLPRKKKRNRKSIHFEKWLQLPCGLQGIHLQGREPRKNSPRPKKSAKSRNIQNCPSDNYELGWMNDEKKVTFQLVNQAKKMNKTEKTRRRRQKRNKTKKSKKVPKQTSSSKGTRSLRNPDTPAMDENVFTGYDPNNLIDPMREMDLSDGFPHAKTEDEPVCLESKLNGAFINEVDAQPAIEVCQESIKNKHQSLEDLEETLRNLQVQDDVHDINHDDVLYQIEGTVEDMSWLYFPRAGNNFGARFELPIDLRKLKTMTPLEYLSQYVVATRCRQRLIDVVFERHASESKMSTEKLFLSLTEILGFHLDSQAEEKLSQLTDLVSFSELTREQFAGIGALAERIGRSGISRRDDLELTDFNLLHKKMSYLEMSQLLRNLFMFISEIDVI